jgi:hypothetical protein
VNNWVYHPFIPKFYHIEVKKYNKDIIKRRIEEKGSAFENTIFVVNKKKPHLLDVIGKQNHIYGYISEKINVKNEPIIPNYKPTTNPNKLTCNLNTSFTTMLELLCRFKYKKVIFFGVDLYNARYFWTDRPEYGETHCRFNKDHLKGRKPDDPHWTAHIKNFVIWFSKKRMSKHGGTFFVGHKDTELYPGLEYIDIKEISL